MNAGQRRRRTPLIIAIAVLLFGGLIWWQVAGGKGARTKDAGKDAARQKGGKQQRPPFDRETALAQIRPFCGDCHTLPTPDQFPRDGWSAEIDQGYKFYLDSGRNDLKIPPKRTVLRYYRELAPGQFELPRAAMAMERGSISFRPQRLQLATDDQQPAVANVSWKGRQRQGALTRSLATDHLFVCDMRAGFVASVRPGEQATPQIVAQDNIGFPAKTTLVDFDRDGRNEILVADLGSFLPADHNKGRVLLLRRATETAPYEVHELATGRGRITDVQPGDFDHDGDIDLVVAEFGWRTTGRIFLLENQGGTPIPKFREQLIVDRHGCIHLPVVDLNGDGHLDFVAVLSQEHEVVDAFINRGNGTFRARQVFDAGNPSYGSSGVELTDLDQDGDMDALYTNGDMFDGFYVVPYHGIHWIENRDGTWVPHKLASMPGVHRAVAGDLDNDGDLDIVACALVSNRSVAGRGQKGLDSLIYLEQVSPGKFVMRSIEAERCYHASLDLADFDGDNDLDIAVGEFREEAGAAHLTIWWNELVKQKDGPEPGGNDADRGRVKKKVKKK